MIIGERTAGRHPIRGFGGPAVDSNCGCSAENKRPARLCNKGKKLFRDIFISAVALNDVIPDVDGACLARRNISSMASIVSKKPLCASPTFCDGAFPDDQSSPCSLENR